MHFPTFDFSGIKKWGGDWEFDLGNLPWPNLKFDLGLDLRGLFAKMPELKLAFSGLNIDFHFPDVEGFDFDAPVIYLPHFKLNIKPLLKSFSMPKVKIPLPEWTGLGETMLNLPLEIYLDWGDGQDPYTLKLSTALTSLDMQKELSKLLSHTYPKPGIYQGEVGIRLRYVNAVNKNFKFTIVVANEDFDNDGIPNMWEVLYQGDGEEGPGGLDPLNPSDANQDFDHDALTCLQEFLAGTHPLEADHDGDEMPDGFEVMYMVPPKGKSYKGMNPWKADGTADADHDGMKNVEEYKYDAGGGDFGLPAPYDNYSSTNPMDPDTDDGGMEDGQEFKSKGTDKERNPFDPTDDADHKDCCIDDCKQEEWNEETKQYECVTIEDCERKEKPTPDPPCASWVADGKDDRGCRKWKLVEKKDCPKKDDPPKTNNPTICKDIEAALCKYCAACKDGIVQWDLPKVQYSLHYRDT